MQPKFCSKCGNALKEGDNFCRKCGAPIKMTGNAPAPQAAARRPEAAIPSYDEMRRRFDRPGSNAFSEGENPEGTVLLAGTGTSSGFGDANKKANITLSFEEMLRGCSKVVDFGTGKRYELVIPGGLSPGDRILVKNTGIIDQETGAACDIELTAVIG